MNLETARSNLHIATDRRRALEQEIHYHDQNLNIYGSREDVESQGAEHESPIGGMFNTWNERHRSLETERLEQRLQSARRGLNLPQIEHTRNQLGPLHQQDPRNSVTQDGFSFLNAPPRPVQQTASHFSSAPPQRHQTLQRDVDRRVESFNTARAAIIAPPALIDNAVPSYISQRNAIAPSLPLPPGMAPPAWHPHLSLAPTMVPGFAGRTVRLHDPWSLQRAYLGHDEFYTGSDDDDDEDSEGGGDEPRAKGGKGLDKDDGRPKPVEEKDLFVKMECKICYGQLATVAVLPCGRSFFHNICFDALKI